MQRAAKVRPEDVEGLVVAAVDRLLADGLRFADLQMQRIADEAGVARSTLYLHYADKTSLLLALADRATAELFAASEAWVAAGAEDRASLEHAVRTVVAQRRANRGILDALDDATGYDIRAAEYWRARVGAYIEQFAARLERDQQRGRVAAGLDPHAAASLATWGIERATAQHVATEPASADTRFAQGLADTVWLVLSSGIR